MAGQKGWDERRFKDAKKKKIKGDKGGRNKFYSENNRKEA